MDGCCVDNIPKADTALRNKAVISQYFAFANAERWDDLRTLFCDDARLIGVGARERAGLDDVMSYFTRIFNQWPEHHDEPVSVIEEGDTLAVEIEFVGRGHDGRVITFDAVDVFHMRGDKIARMSTWYDSAYVGRFLQAGSNRDLTGPQQ